MFGCCECCIHPLACSLGRGWHVPVVFGGVSLTPLLHVALETTGVLQFLVLEHELLLLHVALLQVELVRLALGGFLVTLQDLFASGLLLSSVLLGLDLLGDLLQLALESLALPIALDLGQGFLELATLLWEFLVKDERVAFLEGFFAVRAGHRVKSGVSDVVLLHEAAAVAQAQGGIAKDRHALL